MYTYVLDVVEAEDGHRGPHFRDKRKIKYKSRIWHGCEGVDEDT